MENRASLHYRLCGLDYVYLENVPVAMTASGSSYVDLPMGEIDGAIARKIVAERVPLRGAEVAFLRKALGMTLNQWGERLGLTAAAILKWERARDKRLSKINEAAVRSLCADLLDIPMDGRWSVLIANDRAPERLSLKVG
jgi:DNA-binding transcriptional regulator YiaG